MKVVRDGMGGQMRLIHKFQDTTSEILNIRTDTLSGSVHTTHVGSANGNKSEIRSRPSGVYTHNFYPINSLEG